MLITTDSDPDYWGLRVESGSTIDDVNDAIYVGDSSGEITTDELTGKVIEIITPGLFSKWLNANTTPASGECNKPHINIVDELPETGTEGAFYGVNGAFVYLRMGADSGIWDFEKYMDLPEGGYIFIRTNSEELQDMPVPDGVTDAYFLVYCDDVPELYLGVAMGGRWMISPMPFTELLEGSSCKGEITDTTEATEDGYYLFIAPSQICQFIMRERIDFVKKGTVLYEDWEGDISKATGIGRYYDENIIIQSTSPYSGYPVTEITHSAFSSVLIRSVAISNTVEKIDTNAFQDCVALESIDFPDKHIEFGSFAFARCYSLGAVTISEGQSYLSDYMFESCLKLSEVYLPSSLTKISAGAFSGCTKLNKITFGGTMEQWQSVTFGSDWNKNVPAIKVICSDGETPITISFTIATADNGSIGYKSYYANKNMTWAEWINSEYNTDSRFENINNGVWDTQNEAYVYTSGDSNGTQVNTSDKIIEYATYYIPYESV
jgi:hypothetical protein